MGLEEVLGVFVVSAAVDVEEQVLGAFVVSSAVDVEVPEVAGEKAEESSVGYSRGGMTHPVKLSG
jgi:hypothetical protein